MHQRLPWILLVFSLFITAISAGAEKNVFLVHAKTSLKLDDAQICAVPNVALTALKKGYRVIILFDASGVTAISKHGFFAGGKTPLDRAPLPERERQSLATQLQLPLAGIPHDYGEYIHFLKQRGVELYVNRTMMLLYQIDDGDIDPQVTPVGLSAMVDLMAAADIYVAY